MGPDSSRSQAQGQEIIYRIIYKIGLTDPQIDALNAAATRAGAAALAEMKRVIRPLSAEEYSKIPNIEWNGGEQTDPEQRFIVPDWHLTLAAGRAALNSEILSIAGPEVAELLSATTECYWEIGESTRILTLQDRPEEGWHIRDFVLSSRGSSSSSSSEKELPAHWKSLFQVTEAPAPISTGKADASNQ